MEMAFWQFEYASGLGVRNQGFAKKGMQSNVTLYYL